MGIQSYVISFIASAVLSLIFTRHVRDYAIRRGWVQEPLLDRHVHKKPVPRLGGIAIYLCVLVVGLVGMFLPKLAGMAQPLEARSAFGILAPATLVFLLGIYDDLYTAGPYLKFGIQTIAGILLYFDGNGIQRFTLLSHGRLLQTVVALPLTVLWVLLISNAFNLIDGLDGLAGGSAFFSTMVLFVVSLFGANPLVTFLSTALAGAILGFLRYNFYPASIFMGDSGSLFVGFMLSALALTGMQKASTMIAVAIPVLCFGLPLLDVALAVVRRFLREQPLFSADGEHIHHRLLKQGLSQRQAVSILYAASACFGLLSLALLHDKQIIALVFVVVGIGVWLGVQQLRYVETFELQEILRRTMQKKRIFANNLKVRRGIESLASCNDFRAICKILEETLQPVGFDGVLFHTLDDDGISEAHWSPLKRDADGSFLCCWSDSQTTEYCWELKLELAIGPGNNRGRYFSLFRTREKENILVDLNLLSTHFRTVLGDAFDRAMSQAGAKLQDPIRHETPIAIKATSAR